MLEFATKLTLVVVDVCLIVSRDVVIFPESSYNISAVNETPQHSVRAGGDNPHLTQAGWG